MSIGIGRDYLSRVQVSGNYTIKDREVPKSHHHPPHRRLSMSSFSPWIDTGQSQLYGILKSTNR